MCLRPYHIRNSAKYRQPYISEFGHSARVPQFMSSSYDFIEVPCGTCAECRATYFNSVLQRGLVESMSSYLYFVTLTYDNDHIPSLHLPGGPVVFFSDYADVQLMMKRFRNANLLDRDFRYLCVNEYGDTNHRPHVHLIFFVGKRHTDTSSTPYFIRQILFDNLGKFFACNVGTRKHPQYEPLFTYKYRITSSGPKTNYYVEYVVPPTEHDYLRGDDNSNSYIKTLRYLLGYVNKSSSFDDTICQYLEDYSDDVQLVTKLRNILRSRIRYSKGYGCGFVDGYKHYIPLISVRASGVVLHYSELIDNLPSDYDTYKEYYLADAYMLQRFINSDIYSRYPSLDYLLEHISPSDFHYHCLFVKYFPKEWSRRYYKYFGTKAISEPKVSYFFAFRPYQYNMSKVRTHLLEEVSSSPVYQTIRSMVEHGLHNKAPYLSFVMPGSQTFTALCKFYKDRCTTLDDIVRLYRSLKVKNYDEWLNLFQRQLDITKAVRQVSNEILHDNSEDVLEIQKNCLISCRNYQYDAFYRFCFR